jgi:hypothetical protein
MSEADYWNASSDLFTGAHLSDGNTNLPPTTSLEESAFSERRKRILAVVLLAAVLGGAVFTEPDLFLSFLNTDSYEEMEDPDEADLIGEETPDEDMGEDGEITGDILGEEDEIEGDDPSLEDIADNEETVDPNMDNEVVDGEVAPAEEEQFAEAPPQELGENEIDWKDNPYWNLPNHFSESIDKPLETWTVEQEEAWRENLDSKFIWQKYKVLDEIKDARLAGSEVLLWDLTREKKLWLRLKALMALADFGEKVSIKDVLDAVENARPSTIANFVKRFRKDSSVGELFVLRQMVRIMDTRGRYEILRVLKDQSDKYSDLYLTAGSLDPDEKVSRWAERKISSIEEKDLERLTLVVQGKAAFEDETLLLDQQAAENAEKEKNLFGGMVDPVAEREKERIENEKKNGNLFAEDEGIEEEEFEEDEDMEEVMIYE